MKLKRKTLNYLNTPSLLNWRNGELIDWVQGGNVYQLDEEIRRSGRGYAYRFDAAIQDESGVYAIIYERAGTKALLLKNGAVHREMNRSYYQAAAYEYPIAFAKLKDGRQILIHCPQEYNQIEIEDLETGEKLHPDIQRKPDDCFHSRLRVNAAGTYLLNAGWVWHPYGMVQVYDINACLENPSLLDDSNTKIPINCEVCSAEFLTNDLVYINATFEESLDEMEADNYLNQGELALYSISQNKFLKKVLLNQKLGTLIPIDENFVLDLYEFPKLINMNTGEIVQKFEDIQTGKQDSSIIWSAKYPPVAVDLENKRIAIGGDKKIEILEVEQPI